MTRIRLAVLTAVFALAGGMSEAAMYKWVDGNGTTHYGDNVPPRYAHRAESRGARPAVPQKTRAATPAPAPGAEADEARKAEAKRELERQRQDRALLATYASESEIELARARELKRSRDTLKAATAGLVRSEDPADQRKLDALMAQGREEIDDINARFDAQLARYRELVRARGVDAATAAR